jgi:hypothetical protein
MPRTLAVGALSIIPGELESGRGGVDDLNPSNLFVASAAEDTGVPGFDMTLVVGDAE